MLVGSTFYSKYVTPMPANETPQYILDRPKLKYFAACRGNIDGSHVYAWVRLAMAISCLNRKGFSSQNVLAASDFDNKFIYILSGWEGSASDSRVFDYARRTDLQLSPGTYFLADAGFPLCDMLMTPYRGKRYHLNEWTRSGAR
jgi:hypothetical protein